MWTPIDKGKDKYKVKKEELENLLTKYTQKQIASMLGIHVTTVRYRIKKLEIDKSMLDRSSITISSKMPKKEELATLIQKSTLEQIGQYFGVSRQAVYGWLKKYNLETPQRQRWKHGTVYAYQTRYCRCDLCRKAASDHYFSKKNKKVLDK